MISFEWDDAKARGNYRKHRITFHHAMEAFKDRFAVEMVDSRSADYGEDRIVLIGRAKTLLLTVVYVERGEIIRLISARRSTRTEQDAYYRDNAQS